MRLFTSLLVVGLFAALPALAQQAPPAVVGRIAFLSGTVAFHRAGETPWSAATLNYPVASGISLWTERNSRAEIRIGPDTIAMDDDTELDLDRLDAEVTRITVPAGRIDLHLRRLGAGQSFEIDIPRGAVHLLAPGIYDIAAGGETEPARVAVFAGRAHFTGGGADLGIDPGVVALLNGFDPVSAIFAQAEGDSFVAWCRARDVDETKLVAPRYVATEMTGYAALDRYGRWREISGYGAVWFPNAVAPGWAPYRDGSWIWLVPWGWTWVDNAPWGFAPSHYGRWAVIGGAWGWVPGRRVPRPVYAPAVVAFIDGFFLRDQPLVAWFPLAPGEVYWPSYTRNIAYIRALNVPDARDADRIVPGPDGRPPRPVLAARYANQRFAVLVPERAFAGGSGVRRAALPIAPTRLERVPATFASPLVQPVVARPLPPPPVRRAAVAASLGRAMPAPAPLVRRPAHRLAARGRIGHARHRPEGAPHPPRPAAVTALPLRSARPLPPNAAMLPPLLKHPHAAHGPGGRPRGTVGMPPPQRRETFPAGPARPPGRAAL
jgi:hypothetical protein